jgi:hypothetical protein
MFMAHTRIPYRYLSFPFSPHFLHFLVITSQIIGRSPSPKICLQLYQTPIATPNQQTPLKMCVKPIHFSCGAMSHMSLRNHEARFLINPRSARDVCSCDRVMDVPRLMARKCETCEKQKFTILDSIESRAGAHRNGEELSGHEL